jgi:O-phosphoseryl-tRNA(Cys) synthetase
MNAACPVALAEIANDRPVSSQQLAMRSEIRMEVIDVAERIIRGEKIGAKVLRYGIPYTKELAMIDFFEHQLSDDAIFAAWNGDRMPLTDLLTRIVQRVVAVAWYGEADADTLGFSK